MIEMKPCPLENWNQRIENLPGAHLLQTSQWAESKVAYGWKPLAFIWEGANEIHAAALVLERTVRLSRIGPSASILYVPRGPMLDWENSALRERVLSDLQNLARQRKAIFIKIDPEWIVSTGFPEENHPAVPAIPELVQAGWLFAKDQIQFRNTVWIDLAGSEDDWLARMKQKTRYNIRLATKKGVTVRQGDLSDLGFLYRMYAETSVRDGFVIRPESYYHAIWERFIQAGMAQILLAEVEGQPVAGLVQFFFAGHAWYLYGMSRDLHRDKMPNYLLQWEAMREAGRHGCRIYDLWGAPDVFDESDSMWGVYRFKEGLGGEVIRTVGAWDYPARPLFYRLYTQLLPRILDIMRRRGKEKTRQEVL